MQNIILDKSGIFIAGFNNPQMIGKLFIGRMLNPRIQQSNLELKEISEELSKRAYIAFKKKNDTNISEEEKDRYSKELERLEGILKDLKGPVIHTNDVKQIKCRIVKQIDDKLILDSYKTKTILYQVEILKLPKNFQPIHTPEKQSESEG